MTRAHDSTSAVIAARLATQRDRSVAGLRALRRELTKELRALGGSEVVALAGALVHEHGCPRWLAYELVHHHREARLRLTAASLNRLGKGLSDWGSVDAFAVYLLGPAYRDGNVDEAEIVRWAASKDRFRRRAALACTVALNTKARGGSGDAARTLVVCDRLLGDRDDLVVKAMSWALRELAVRAPREVERYLSEHQAELAARVLREVRNKLETGSKNPKLKGS